MKYNLETLEKFAADFAGNWQKIPGYMWTDSTIANSEKWGVHPTQTTNGDLVEKVNSEQLNHLLWVYLYHKSKRGQQVKYLAKFATPAGIIAGFMIRVYDDTGTITPACMTLYDHLHEISDHGITDPESLDKLEAEIFADEWPEIFKAIVVSFTGETWPFSDGEYEYYIKLTPFYNSPEVSALFLKYNPRSYWHSMTGHFDLQRFLRDVTDGRLSVKDILFTCPHVVPSFSAQRITA